MANRAINIKQQKRQAHTFRDFHTIDFNSVSYPYHTQAFFGKNGDIRHVLATQRSARCRFEQPLLFPRPLPRLFSLALVAFELAFAQPDFELDAPIPVVQVQGHKRIAALLDLADQAQDVWLPQQQLA